MNTTRTWSSLGLAALALAIAGCSSQPKNGEDKTAYYYSSGTRAPVTGVAPVAVAPRGDQGRGPANVARIVYFDFDSAQIRPEYRSVIEAHAQYLRSQANSRVQLTGHTDQRGGSEYNLALGQRRAQSVEQALTQLGVPQDRIESVSYGKEQPASMEQTEAGYQLNRRVEFVYR